MKKLVLFAVVFCAFCLSSCKKQSESTNLNESTENAPTSSDENENKPEATDSVVKEHSVDTENE